MASASGRRSRSSRRVSPPKSAELLRSDSQMQLCADLGLRLADGAGPRHYLRRHVMELKPGAFESLITNLRTER